jgi:hypothetical protein
MLNLDLLSWILLFLTSPKISTRDKLGLIGTASALLSIIPLDEISNELL